MPEETRNKEPLSGIMKKLCIIFALLLILLIALIPVSGIVSDRENYRDEAIQKIAGGWASRQKIFMPQMRTLYMHEINKQNQYLFYTLDDCTIDVSVKNEYRKIGIFKIPVYTADIKMKGSFLNDVNVKNNKALLSFNVSNSRGFTKEPLIGVFNKTPVKNIDKDIEIQIPNNTLKIPFEIQFQIRGANSLNFMTGANFAKVNIKSDWADPSFEGGFLPAQKNITDKGFSASWSIPKIATDSDTQEQYGVSFLIPVDNYRMTERAVKYGVLFLVLTFSAFFVFEIVTNIKVHPIQYLLIGSSLVVFYLMLLALSEFCPFWTAYVCSSALTIALISAYAYSVDKKLAAIIKLSLVALYIYLYLLLILKDLSLLVGSFGLFAIIAVIMYSTRKIQWYKK